MGVLASFGIGIPVWEILDLPLTSDAKLNLLFGPDNPALTKLDLKKLIHNHKFNFLFEKFYL